MKLVGEISEDVGFGTLEKERGVCIILTLSLIKN